MRIKPPNIKGYVEPPKHPPILKICPTCGIVFKAKWNSARKKYQTYNTRECVRQFNSQKNRES